MTIGKTVNVCQYCVLSILKPVRIYDKQNGAGYNMAIGEQVDVCNTCGTLTAIQNLWQTIWRRIYYGN